MTTCSIDLCERAVHALGYCGPHYQRWRAHGDPLAGGPPREHVVRHHDQRTKPCEWDGCDRRALLTGKYCKKHRHQARRLGLIDARTCLEPGCDGMELARGLCHSHYHQYRRLGTWPIHADGDPDAWDAAALLADARLREAAAAARINQAALRLLHPAETADTATTAADLLVEALRELEAS